MSDETPRLRLPQLVSQQEQNHVTWNEALARLDALADLVLSGQYVNDPPASPSDGDAYLIGGAPTGAWSGNAYKIASCLDGAWRFHTPFNGLRAFVVPTGAFIVYLNGTWTDWNSLISANEVPVASATTCDLGAAGALFVQITGNTAITSFGSGANKLRFVRFAQALTLTHNAASLILLGGASRTTAAGDLGLYASDANGNWRERSYVRAAADAGALVASAAPLTSGGVLFGNSGRAAQDASLFWDGTSHRLLIGSTTSYPVAGSTNAALQVHGISSGQSSFLFANWEASANGKYPAFYFGKSAGGAVGTHAAVADGDVLGVLAFYGSNGTQFDNCGSMRYVASGTVGSTVPVRVDITTKGQAGTLATRIAIDNAGNVGIGTASPLAALDVAGSVFPHTANAHNLGSASYYWANGYIQNAWTVISDESVKDEIAPLSEGEIAAAKDIAPLIVLYKMKAAIAAKGSAAARRHCGWIAQRVVEAFEAHGLDPFAYGCVGFDPAMKTVTHTRPIRDEDGNAAEETYETIEPDLDEAGNRKNIFNIRPEELTAFALAGLAARIAALEGR